MISKALNLSDRLSGCTKLARRMLAEQKSNLSIFHFLQTMARKGHYAELYGIQAAAYR